MYTSHIINKPYRYETHNLLDLKKKILADHNYSRLDIVNGYHQKDSYILEYDYSDLDKTFSDEVVKKLHEMYDKSLAELVRVLDASYERNVQRCAEVEHEIQEELPNFTFEGLEDFTKYTGWGQVQYGVQEYCKRVLSCTEDVSHIVAKVEEFRQFCYNRDAFDETHMYRYCNSNRLYATPDLLEAIFMYYLHEEGMLEDFRIYSSWHNCSVDCLPKTFRINDTNTLKSDDFLISNAHVKLNCKDENIIRVPKETRFMPHPDTIRYDDLVLTVYKVFHNAQKYYNDAIEKAINKVSIADYLFNIMTESMPIVINRNSRTNKVELIDGYKRLLVNNDNDQLNTDTAIKVFDDLSDVDFLKLLFALNEWKLMSNEDLYDRGLLFALREHFGIKQEDYPTTNTRYDVSDYSFNMSLLNILRLYGEDSSRVPNQYANDILQLKNILVLYEETSVIKNEMFKAKLFKSLIKVLGELRRENCSSENDDVIDVFRSVINNSQLVEMLNKKSKTKMPAWVNNYWRDNHFDDKLKEFLKEEINIKE